MRNSAPILLLATLMAAVTGLGRCDFVAPAEGPVPFHRDRLPLDADRMREMSGLVFALIGPEKPADPAGLRRSAQILALSLALDPANRQARNLVDQWSQKSPSAAAATGVSADETAAADAALRPGLDWLGGGLAGEDAQAFSLCLGDLLKPSEGTTGPEAGNWKGWIADLEDFKAKPEPVVAKVDETPSTDPVPKPPKQEILPTALPTAQILIPVRKSATGTGGVKIVPLKMTGTTGNPGGTPLLHLEGDKDNRIEALEEPLKTALTKTLGSLPKGLKLDLEVGGKDGYNFGANGRGTLAGGSAVLVNAAISGDVPAPVIVFANVEANGRLSLPSHFWPTLRAIPEAPAARIIVPKECAEYLTSLLTIDGPGFFMKHEVIVAENVKELCALATKQPDPGEASRLFAEVQGVAEGKSLGSFLANPATVKRLEQITAAMPGHASARLLAMQGAGSRPRYLPRKLVAVELRTALEPLRYIVDSKMADLEPGALDTQWDQSRKAIEKLTGFLESKDREMLKQSTDSADTLRTLARALRMNDTTRYTEVANRREEAFDSAVKSIRNILDNLGEVAAEAGK